MSTTRRLSEIALCTVLCACAQASSADDGSGPSTGESEGSEESQTGDSGSETTDADGGWTGEEGTESGENGDDGDDGGIVSAPETIDFEFCETGIVPNAAVSGTTPNGAFDGRYAWFGWLTCDGEGVSPTLVIVEDPADLEAAVGLSPNGGAVPKPSLEWFLLGACSPEGGWVGEGKVTVYLRDDDADWRQVSGNLEIEMTERIFDDLDPENPPRMHGSLFVAGNLPGQEGWSIDGTFSAAYCGPLSYDLDC